MQLLRRVCPKSIVYMSLYGAWGNLIYNPKCKVSLQFNSDFRNFLKWVYAIFAHYSVQIF